MCHGGFSGSNIDTFPGRIQLASHAATDNMYTTHHSYVAIVVLKMQLTAI